MPDPFQRCFNLLPFFFQLRLVRQMLQLAAAAGFVNRANRFDPVRGSRNDFLQFSDYETLFDKCSRSPYRFTGEGSRHKYRNIFKPSYAFPRTAQTCNR